MISAATMTDFALDGASPTPLYRQLHSRIAGAVLDGRLSPGARLPSARSLAAQLAIARGTVEAAYQMLAGEGYVVTRGAAGTLVDPALDRRLLKPARVGRTGTGAVEPTPESTPAAAPPLFRMGLPALDAFPRKLWSRLVARQARALGPADLAYQPPPPATSPCASRSRATSRSRAAFHVRRRRCSSRAATRARST